MRVSLIDRNGKNPIVFIFYLELRKTFRFYCRSPMSQVPNEIREWINYRDHLQSEIKRLQAAERQARDIIIKHFFPTPKDEGSMSFTGDGVSVKAAFSLSRKLKLDTLEKTMLEMDAKHKPFGRLLGSKWTFDLPYFRAMPDDQQKIFCQTLEIEAGSPQLTIETRK